MSNKQDYTIDENTTVSTIRDYLVGTAVNFLQNPEVRKRHDESKINFLKKKGLTEAEISAAFDRVKVDSNMSAPLDLVNKCHQPVPPNHRGHSLLSRLTGISSSVIVFSVALYGLHHLYKRFVRPWLLNEDADSQLNHMKELTKNLAMLTETVEKLHTTVMKQNEEINKLLQIEGCGYAPTPVILEDVKREVSSLKSILISRHQFPAMPLQQTIKATIPLWQLPSDSSSPPADNTSDTPCPGADEDIDLEESTKTDKEDLN